MNYSHSLILPLILISLSVSGSAAERITTGYRLGYCQGRMSDECNYSYDGKTSVSTAIQVSQPEAERLAGNCVEAVRLAIHSKIKVDSLSVWVANALDAPLHEHTVSRRDLATGWNVIELDAPHVITPDLPLYIGYTYWQSGQSYVISSPLSRNQLSTPFWLKTGDSEWLQTDDEALTLSLEAVLSGDALPQYDAQLISLQSMADSLHSGQDIYLTGELRNCGLQPITSLSLNATSDVFQPFDIDLSIPLAYGEESRFALRIPTSEGASADPGQLTLTITTLDGTADEWTIDNEQQCILTLSPELWVRNVLCEEFTSEPCGNCPRVAEWLREAHEKHPLANRIQIAAHHVGFADDLLTIEESRPYTGFFSGPTFNPGIMCDRQHAPLPDKVVYNPQSVNDIMQSWDYALSRPTTVALSMDGEWENDSVLTVNVRGQLSPDFSLTAPHITVMVVEDSIAAIYQAGAGTDWIHQHATRAISSTWGDPINQTGNAFATELSLTLPEGFVASHCTVIAFVSEYTERTITRYIENSLSLPLACIVAPSPKADDQGISTIRDYTNHSPKCYTLSGQAIRHSALPSGPYIEDGHIVILKR